MYISCFFSTSRSVAVFLGAGGGLEEEVFFSGKIKP